MKRISIITLLAIAVLSGCKQESFPESIFTEPAFRVEMSVNNESMTLTPGVNGYYMHTQFNGLAGDGARLESGIAPANCVECGPALWVEMQSAFGQVFVAEDELVPGQLAFSGAGQSDLFFLHMLNFEQFPQNLGSGIVVNDEILPTPNIVANTDELGLEVQFQYPGFPFFNAFGTVNITEDGLECLGPAIIESIGIDIIEPGSIQLYHPGGYAADREVLWVVNDTDPFVSVDGDVIELDLNPADGVFVQALILGEDLEPVWVCSLALPEFSVGTFEALRFTLNPVGLGNETRVGLRYVDADGNQYRSEDCESGGQQGAGSSFEITQASDFGQNEFGSQTRKLTFNAVATLFPVDNPDLEPVSIQISNAEFAFAIE